jgi:CubicO group peptidase (beta-lactamase class C family)
MLRRHANSHVLGLILLLATSTVAVAEEKTPLAGFDEYVQTAMKDWKVPGVAIAVVKDDKVVLLKGYGVRKMGEPALVDAQTRFAIASCTKAFTAAGLAMLVDEGKISWDDPVIKHLPGFLLDDPYVTREVTIRDLLCHRTGLPAYEAVWYGSTADRSELIRRMRFMKPTSGFRSQFGYQNICYLAAGQIIPAVTHTSWDDFMTQRLFAPLGMTSSTTRVVGIEKAENVASPHHEIEGTPRIVPYRNNENIGPAGSIYSSATDMAQWVRLLLAKGEGPKGRLLSAQRVEELFTPQIFLPSAFGIEHPGNHFVAYGLGWNLFDYRGRLVAFHMGSIDGMKSEVALVPEEHLGIVVLSNYLDQALPYPLVMRIIDAYLGAPPRDWNDAFHKFDIKSRAEAKEREAKTISERVPGTKPSLALKGYLGTYRDDLHDDVMVSLEKDVLVIHYGTAFVGTLEHWHYDTFRVNWRDPVLNPGMATFVLGADGKCVGINVMIAFDQDREWVELKKVTAKPKGIVVGPQPSRSVLNEPAHDAADAKGTNKVCADTSGHESRRR